MTLKANFLLMADYNEWMNESVYEAASRLTPDDLEKNTGAFFGSILGTLNHILVSDIIWLKRFAAHPKRFRALEYVSEKPFPEKLSAILYHDLEALRKERGLVDNVIKHFASELSDETLESSLTYVNTAGSEYRKRLSHVIQHFFNHQTHHRGQVTTLLSQFGVEVGVTDLLANLPDV